MQMGENPVCIFYFTGNNSAGFVLLNFPQTKKYVQIQALSER